MNGKSLVEAKTDFVKALVIKVAMITRHVKTLTDSEADLEKALMMSYVSREIDRKTLAET